MMSKGIYEFVNEAQLKKYAELAVRAGVSMQKNQLAVIHSDIENAVFARLVQTEAYKAGASNVVIDWSDEQSTKEFYIHAADDAISHFPDWQVARYKEWDDAGVAYIHIISENFDVFDGIAAERMSRFRKASRTKLKSHHSKVRSHEVRWCLIAVPSVSWATKVFPGLREEAAVHSLWKYILKGARADGVDPVKDWESHGRAFGSRKKFLNDIQFTALRFMNGRGTDLSVGLPANHLFLGGGVADRKGMPFFPNIPTEEIFTAPHKHKVNGKLVATKPLIYGGHLVEDFSLTFKDGRIIDYYAAAGQDALQSLIETDKGSHYLGEIALVSNKSPLSQMDTLFYNTLFDENAACHIGIGNASPSTLQNGSGLSEEELNDAGLNASLLSVNITFGSRDMKVTGIKENGMEVLLMEDGDFLF